MSGEFRIENTLGATTIEDGSGNAIGIEGSPLVVMQKMDELGVLNGVLKEIKKMNMQLALITDCLIENSDIE